MIDPELNNRVAMVTGGNNPLGIGAATARAFAAQGAALFIHFLRQPVPEYEQVAGSSSTDGPSPIACLRLTAAQWRF
jgi:3-oxoacyl-[acyl-carrier protein] reductase